MSNLKITLVQPDTFWKDREANLARIEELLAAENEIGEVVILPEMFTTGFVMEPEGVAEPVNFHTFKWMQMQAARWKTTIVGSYIVKEGTNYYNRLYVVKEDGSSSYYDKKHLFRMLGENDAYEAGDQNLVLDINGFKFSFFICYDLRFPVWSRQKGDRYDVSVFVANWPGFRDELWKMLLHARAAENVSFAIGVNRVGKDENDIDYAGSSMIAGPEGQKIGLLDNKEQVRTFEISKDYLDEYRNKFPAHLDADDFEIK